MNICVLHRYPLSLVRGTNPSFAPFLRKLMAAGHMVTFVSLRETESGWDIPGVRTAGLPFALSRGSSLGKLTNSLRWTLQVPAIIWRMHRYQPFDLIYCDDSFPLYGWLIKKLTGARTMIRLGDSHSAYLFASGGWIKRVLFQISLGCEKFMWRGVDRVIPISEAFRQFLIHEGIVPEKIAWVQECIDMELFCPRPREATVRRNYGISSEVPLVVFHGLVAPMKGLETFVRAVPLVRSNVTSTRFLIIGDGPSLPGLKRLAAKLRLGDTLQFTGWVPFQDMSQYLAEATVGVPCRSGNLGNNFVVTTALLQYWAMEKPIVAPDLKAIRSTVQHGKNGLLFQPDNPSSLADGILRLLSDSEMAARVGRAGRETALRQFNVDTVSDCMLKALDIDCPSWSS